MAVNHIYSEKENPNALWYALPDVVISVILTGRIPTIIDAFRLKPNGRLKELNPISLRGSIPVDPGKEDFFKVVIEERNRLALRDNISQSEKDRLNKALKVTANATSYGIYAEMNRQESDDKVDVVCHGIDPQPFTCRVNHPEVPGKYCFPPLASLITSAARLMLALLEKCVSDQYGAESVRYTNTKSGIRRSACSRSRDREQSRCDSAFGQTE